MMTDDTSQSSPISIPPSLPSTSPQPPPPPVVTASPPSSSPPLGSPSSSSPPLASPSSSSPPASSSLPKPSPSRVNLQYSRSPKIRSRSISQAGAGETALFRTSRRTVYTAGRPPWYNSQGQLKEPFVIAISGGSGSGKTTVAKKIIEALDVQWLTWLSMDSFYKDLSVDQQEQASQGLYNFDHPDAFDFPLLRDVLCKLKEGKPVEVPVYNFTTHTRDPRQKKVYGASVVIFEGIFAFYHKELLELMDMKVFVDTDSDIRLCRRLRRDITQRGRDIEGVITQYDTYVKPAFEYYIAPTMVHADIIIPRGAENVVALNLIVQHIRTKLSERGYMLRSEIARTWRHSDEAPPDSLHILPETSQIKGLHTFIRNRETSRDEFMFYSKRLMRLLLEFAMSFLPYKDVTVNTDQGQTYEGKRLNTEMICGVSILRAGETMEEALCEVVKDVKIGKILIQTNEDTGEPELHYLRLPYHISSHHVLLMESAVATGAAAMMAIRILLDHDVAEENIILLSLLMSTPGVHSLAYAYPKVKLLTTAVDPEVNDQFHIIPGIGNFGDRYFGTESKKKFTMLET